MFRNNRRTRNKRLSKSLHQIRKRKRLKQNANCPLYHIQIPNNWRKPHTQLNHNIQQLRKIRHNRRKSRRKARQSNNKT